MKRTLIAFLVLIVAAAAMAAPPGRGPAPGGGPGTPARGPQGPGPGGPGAGLLPPPAIAEFLSLTEGQITQIQALRETMQSAVEPLAEQQRANHQLIEEALAAGNAARVGELMIANYGIRQQIKAAHDSFKASFEALLTAEQKAKWAVYEEIVELRHKRPE